MINPAKMNLWKKTGALPAVFVLVVAVSASHAENLYPLGQTLFSFDYEAAYRNCAIMQDMSLFPPTGPFSVFILPSPVPGSSTAALRMLGIKTVLAGSETLSDRDIPDALRLFTVNAERFRAAHGHRGDELPVIGGGVAYRPGRYVGVLSYFNLDRARAVDPGYTGKKYRGLAGEVESALIHYRRNKFSLTLGRSRLFWGPQRVNLLLSETAEPFDLIGAAYRTRVISFHFLFARLDGSRPDEADSLQFPGRTFDDNRYLVGHRLDVQFHRRLRVGLFETVLYGGEGRPPELYYLNPLQFFHAAQLNENEDDNTILGADFTLLPGRGSAVYGQFIVDDFQIDDKSQGDEEPNEIGFMVGVFKAGKVASLIPDIKFEYVQLTNRTYHQRDPRNRYLYRNKLIGHPLGPDADSMAVTARFWPGAQFSAEVELAYRRKGEGSIYKPWDEPWLLAAGEYDEPFPTGVVEKAGLVAIRARGYLPFTSYIRNHFFFAFQAGWGEIHNFENTGKRTEHTAWIDFSLSWLGFTDVRVD